MTDSSPPCYSELALAFAVMVVPLVLPAARRLLSAVPLEKTEG